MPGIAITNPLLNPGAYRGGANQLPASLPGTTSGAGASGGPAALSSPYTNNGNNGGGIGAALSGQPGYGAYAQDQAFIKDPNAANYTIAGTQDYQKQMRGIADQYNALGTNAANFGNAQNAIGNQQNTDFQQQLAQSTNQFLGNAQGLGNYDSGLAGQGAQQQQSAYNDIANLAAGNGPSLAAKNLQAGLNSSNQAIQAQAMTNQGLNGAGNTQRNLLNAQAANANNFAQAAGQASAAEQLGALGQESNAASNLRASNQAQASAASSAGLAQRSQNAGALSTLYGNQLAGNAQQNNNAVASQNLGLGFENQGITGASNAYGNAYQSNVNQQQGNQAYDAAVQNAGNTRANINIAGQQSEAGQGYGVTQTAGNAGQAIGQGIASGSIGSDENIKTDIMKGSAAEGSLDGVLDNIITGGYSAPTAAKTDVGNVPSFADAGQNTFEKLGQAKQGASAGTLTANKGGTQQGGSSSGGLSGLGAVLGLGVAAAPYVWDGAKWVANEAWDGAKAAGNAIESGAKTVEHGVEDAWDWATSWL